jgi:dUTP pyrophosphatase
MVEVRIKRLAHAPEQLPFYQTDGAAGMDLRLAGEDIVLNPGERVLAPTGFCVAIPSGYEGQIRMRSGLALKTGILIANAPGTIDSDYRGELKVLVMNASHLPVRIASGERFAQLVISPVVRCQWVETEELTESSRGTGGFGSSGQY